MADPAVAKPEPPTVTVAVDEAQLQKLLEKLASKKQSSWEYWKEKLILPVSLTLAGTLITLIVGLVQSRQAQDNFNNSLQITRIQSREKYLSYFTDKEKDRVSRLPALSSLIDLDATDLAADLLVVNLGRNDEGDDQEQVDKFVLTTGTKLLPRLCYLASYSNYAYEKLFSDPSRAERAPEKQPAANVALAYALRLTNFRSERAFVESMAFAPLSQNDGTSETQMHDGAAIVMAVLASRLSYEEGDKEKPVQENEQLTSKFVALMGSDRTQEAKVAALVGLLNMRRTRELLDVMADSRQNKDVREYARVALSRGQSQPGEVSQAALKILEDVDAPFQLRCNLAKERPQAYKSNMARLYNSGDPRQHRFAVECILDGFRAMDRAEVLARFPQETDAEVKALIVENIWENSWGTLSQDQTTVIAAATKDPSPKIRSIAYSALSDIKSREADQLLIAGLSDSDPSVVRQLVYQFAMRRTAPQRKAFRLQIEKLPDLDQKTELLGIMDRQSGKL